MEGQNNLAEYADPEIYDLENQDFEPDGPFLLAYARQLSGPVLELGCGTGRVTIPLAQAGIEITGLDIVPGMLERAKQKAQGLPIRWVLADVRSFQLQQTFGLIFETGSVFQHQLERGDQEAMLARVREHLRDDGRFIVSVMFPHPDRLGRVESEQEWFTYQDGEGREIRVTGTEEYDPIRQVKLETAYRRWRDADGREFLQVAPMSLRYVFPQEMEALLHYNGFEILERYGGLDARPQTGDSPQLIYVCKK